MSDINWTKTGIYYYVVVAREEYKEEYEELKKHTRAGISIGFLIRESIHQYLEKNKKN